VREGGKREEVSGRNGWVSTSLITLLSYFLYLALCALRRPQCPASKSSTASTPNKRSGRRDGMSLGDALGGDQAQQGNQGE